MSRYVCTFEKKELTVAAMTGLLRRVEALTSGQAAFYGAGDNWSPDIDGSISEMAVARFLNRYWAPGRLGMCDVPGGIEVRGTRHQNGALIIHGSDEDTSPYVLVILNQMRARLAGWLFGVEAKRSPWWQSNQRHPAFFAPQQDLRPVDDLIRFLDDPKWGPAQLEAAMAIAQGKQDTK